MSCAVAAPGIVARTEAKFAHVLARTAHAGYALLGVSDPFAVAGRNGKQRPAILARHAFCGIAIRSAVARTAKVLPRGAILLAPGALGGIVEHGAVALAVYVVAKITTCVAWRAEARVSGCLSCAGLRNVFARSARCFAGMAFNWVGLCGPVAYPVDT